MKIISLSNAYIAMIAIVALSNFLVQFPINDWLTWGAFPYPVSFLITELTNRFYGARRARQVVFAGFIMAAFFSIWLAPFMIVAASLSAFLLSQLLDIAVFNRLRRAAWWQAPFFASLLASLIDTAIFWSIAFYGEPVPLLTWALGDFLVKLSVDLAMLTPFRMMLNRRSARV